MTLIAQTGDTMMSVPSFRRYLQLGRLHASTRDSDLQVGSSGRLLTGAHAGPLVAVWERG
jgi:hypothetical protein